MSARSTAEIVADLEDDAEVVCEFADYDCRCATCRGLQVEAADRLAEQEAEIASLRAAVSFPPHDGQGPDVDPATGDERETTDENGNPL